MKYVMLLLRLSLGSVFLWAFFDKVFGLGFSTTPDKSWLAGVSPTSGFLQFGTKGPFVVLFHGLSGNPLIDWLFMLGLLGVGISLVLGIGMKIAAAAGTLMMILIYLSVFPPVNNPIVDEHIVYIFLLLYFGYCSAQPCSLHLWWGKQAIVKKYSFLL